MTETSETTVRVGDRVRLWIGPPVQGGMCFGEVIGVDNYSNPGVEIRFDGRINGIETCYATHGEIELRRDGWVEREDGRRFEVWWTRSA